MVLLILERGLPLDEVVFYDTGMEFKAIYDTRDRVLPILYDHGVKYTELRPRGPSCSICWKSSCPARRTAFTTVIPGAAAVRAGNRQQNKRPGQTREGGRKERHSVHRIAADEQKRLQRLLYKVAPLAKFGFTEADALAYCYDRGFF